MKKIGDREMMIMNIIWDRGEASVREVHREIVKNEDIAYTSIMTSMKNMEKKDLITHREENRAYIYEAKVSRAEVQGKFLKDLLDSLFKGSYKNLVAGLLNNKKLTPEEIKELADKYLQKED